MSARLNEWGKILGQALKYGRTHDGRFHVGFKSISGNRHDAIDFKQTRRSGIIGGGVGFGATKREAREDLARSILGKVVVFDPFNHRQCSERVMLDIPTLRA